MKKPNPSRWLTVMGDAEYALDRSGSMLFLYALFIGSHVLNSPPYARIAFAVVLLFFLTPKLTCGWHRIKKQRY